MKQTELADRAARQVVEVFFGALLMGAILGLFYFIDCAWRSTL